MITAIRSPARPGEEVEAVVRGVLALLALALFGMSFSVASWSLFAVAVILFCVAIIPRRVYHRPAVDQQE